MKLILCLTLIWGIFSTAGALQCQNCNDSDCTSDKDPTDCSSETMCVAHSFKFTSGSELGQLEKKCDSSLCAATGRQAYSVSWPEYRRAGSIDCCNEDNCNKDVNQTIPAAKPNSLSCYSCLTDGLSCYTTSQCQGNENRCFKGHMMAGKTTTRLWGCMSANLCPPALGQVLFPDVLNITCCGTKLCNSAITTTPTTVCLLLGPLVLLFY
ncbi:hypothetical protein Q5P01_015498 [Channa striata]|uniref:Uncharacterized protein n=1 Tax=Channa striata TaxID=64152 RepID=A0AA88SD47_CHASR|nr:hypothetical protein Q5P01_015498 [Channa striata]